MAPWGDIADRALGQEPPQVVTASSSTAVPSENRFEAARVVAVIGEERILVGDLIDPRKATPEVMSSREGEMYLRQALVGSVARKCMSQHFIQSQVAGKSKKERDEIRTKLTARTAEIFKTQILPEQLARNKCATELEFMELLESKGTSLQALMRDFSEQAWAEQAMREVIDAKPNVLLHELQDFYEAHSDEWDKPSRVRFRIMSIKISDYPSREEAYAAIADMGNQVYLGGASFESVATNRSTGFNRENGGLFDWVSIGSLKSKVVEETVFSIELEALSPILEDDGYYHIVKVLERENAYRMNFVQAQSEIRKRILETKQDQQRRDFIRKIMESTPIWTRWPQDIPGSRDLEEIL